MQRGVVALLVAPIITVAGVGAIVWNAEQNRARDLDELLCLERLHATAAIAVMVPESNVDVDGRIEAVRTLGDALDAC